MRQPQTPPELIMTDIQQWRRMIQPTRARTPALEHEDSDRIASPTTPKKILRPKFPSYFTQHGVFCAPLKAESSFASSNEEAFSPRFPCWPEDEPYPSPKVEILMDFVLCRLMAEPYQALDLRFNGILLQIFEYFRTLADEKAQLQAKLNDVAENQEKLLQKMENASQRWVEERQDYEAEVKRLELFLSEGKRGLAEVTIARQDSLLQQRKQRERAGDDDGLETIFEFLEKTKRYEDSAWSSQRATFRVRQPSPSAQMRRLSKALTSKKSITNIHADLPFGTPPDAVPSTLAEASLLDEQAAQSANECTNTGLTCLFDRKTRFSDDTLSAFSCVGDLLPDETMEINMVEVAGTHDDLNAIKRIANALARRRNVDAAVLVPKLLKMFGTQSLDTARSMSNPITDGMQVPAPRVSSTHKETVGASIQKQPSLISKASLFFHKIRPQLNLDSPNVIGRRFSFEVGDDAGVIGAPEIACMPSTRKGRVLRKSVSIPSILEAAHRVPIPEPMLSPGAESPTVSVPPSEPRRVSRIPTPVHNSGTLARPRQVREDSSSSLLTAIKQSKSTSQGSDSMSSSIISSPSASRPELAQMHQSLEQTSNGDLTSASSNRLLDHTNALRGNAFVQAAARTASTRSDLMSNRNDLQSTSHSSRASSQSSYSACLDLDMSNARSENSRPIANALLRIAGDNGLLL